MSINTDQDLYDYTGPALECPICYDPGKTPETIFARFANVERGALWVPADGQPIYGPKELTALAVNHWRGFVAPHTFDLWLGPAASTLTVTGPGAVLLFVSGPWAICEVYYPNILLDCPNRHMCKGYASLANILPDGDDTIPAIMDSLNLYRRQTTWCNPIPKGASETVYKFYHRPDATNIKVKRDLT